MSASNAPVPPTFSWVKSETFSRNIDAYISLFDPVGNLSESAFSSTLGTVKSLPANNESIRSLATTSALQLISNPLKNNGPPIY